MRAPSIILGLLGGALVACTPVAGSTGSAPVPSTTSPVGTATGSAAQTRGWRVASEEHVDLWLHGFALLTSDTGHVPFFIRGYKQQVTAVKRQRNIFTNLDANLQQLQQRFVANPSLTNAQFLAMYFSSFQEMVTATDLFIRANGEPRAAADPIAQQQIALLASVFPSPADRSWARLFVQSLQDEDTKFYHQYWSSEQQARGAAYAQVNEQWHSQWYPKLSRFLNNTQQGAGELILSIPIGGEGRTVNNSKQANAIAVEFPRTVDAAPEALFGFVHEAVARIVQEAINDNTTPAEQRSGATGGYEGNGDVRGGALLLQRVAPDLLPAYMRFYLRELGRPVPATEPKSAFESAFPLPPAILTAISTGIESVLGGI